MNKPDMPSKQLLKILDKTHRKWQMGNFSFHLFNKANLIKGSNPLGQQALFLLRKCMNFHKPLFTRNSICKYLSKYGKKY